jgi:hypothetical protein
LEYFEIEDTERGKDVSEEIACVGMRFNPIE